LDPTYSFQAKGNPLYDNHCRSQAAN